MAKRNSDSKRLPFEIDSEVDTSLLTAHAGVPLLVELFRTSGAAAVVEERVTLKQRQRGLKTSELTESLVALWAAGGERCEDLNRLREDRGLAELLGHALPAATTIRDFLEGFHREDLPLWRVGEKAVVPAESEPLQGLGEANRQVLAALQKASPSARATLDVDATIMESHKRSATTAYDGTRGYQPVVVVWAEQDAIVQDEFRDGNVPAGCGNRRILEGAVGALPPGVKEKYLRADSALYQNEVMSFCEEIGIGYAISADLTPQLRAALPGEFWPARPKRLRFLLFNTVGKVVHHARRMLLRLGSEVHRTFFELVREKILALSYA